MADRLSTASATGKESDFSIPEPPSFLPTKGGRICLAPAHVPAHMDTHQRDSGRSYSDLAISIAVSKTPRR